MHTVNRQSRTALKLQWGITQAVHSQLMGVAANANPLDTAHHQQRLWRSSDTPEANLAEEGFHNGFHQRSGGSGDDRHDALSGSAFAGGSGGSRKPVRRPSHSTLLRRVQHTNGHKHGQVRQLSASTAI